MQVYESFVDIVQTAYVAYDVVVRKVPVSHAYKNALGVTMSMLADVVAATNAATNSFAVTTMTVLGGMGLDVRATDFNQEDADYLTCLLERSDDINFRMRLFKYSPDPVAVQRFRRRGRRLASAAGAAMPPLDLELELEGGAGAWEHAPHAGGMAGVGTGPVPGRTLSYWDPEAAYQDTYAPPPPPPPTSFNVGGYRVPRVDDDEPYLDRAKPLDNVTRSVGAGSRGNLILGGMLIHQQRRPVASLTKTACGSDFSALEQLCASATAQAYTVNFVDESGMGMDPVFVPGAQIYDQKLSQYPEMWHDASLVNVSVDRFGSPYGFQYLGEDVMGSDHGGGWPVYIAAYLPADRVRKVMLLWRWMFGGGDGPVLLVVFTACAKCWHARL